MFYVYIITNRPHGTLYIGHTDNLEGRMWEYKNRTNKGFAFKYNLDRLVWYEGLETRDDAFVAERQMKAWKRAWKIEAIEKLNPNWDDLALHL